MEINYEEVANNINKDISSNEKSLNIENIKKLFALVKNDFIEECDKKMKKLKEEKVEKKDFILPASPTNEQLTIFFNDLNELTPYDPKENKSQSLNRTMFNADTTCINKTNELNQIRPDVRLNEEILEKINSSCKMTEIKLDGLKAKCSDEALAFKDTCQQLAKYLNDIIEKLPKVNQNTDANLLEDYVPKNIQATNEIMSAIIYLKNNYKDLYTQSGGDNQLNKTLINEIDSLLLLYSGDGGGFSDS